MFVYFVRGVDTNVTRRGRVVDDAAVVVIDFIIVVVDTPLLRRGADGDDSLHRVAPNVSSSHGGGGSFSSSTRSFQAASSVAAAAVAREDAAQNATQGAIVTKQFVDDAADADLFAGGVARLGNRIAGGRSVAQPVRRVFPTAERFPICAVRLGRGRGGKRRQLLFRLRG